MLTGSLSADKIAHVSQLSLKLVEDEVKSYAKQTPNLTCKRLDGRMVLFREGSAVSGKGVGGEGMSLLDRIKTLFNRKGDHERKIAFLSERKAALAQQRDAVHADIEKLDRREYDLRKQFLATDSQSTRHRISSEIAQIRKEVERRQQLMTISNQQINIVSTHLHNLELVQAGKAAQLPSTDEMASDAAAAEETLAKLQADSELADSISTTVQPACRPKTKLSTDELMASIRPVPAATTPSTQTTTPTPNTRPNFPPNFPKHTMTRSGMILLDQVHAHDCSPIRIRIHPRTRGDVRCRCTPSSSVLAPCSRYATFPISPSMD